MNEWMKDFKHIELIAEDVWIHVNALHLDHLAPTRTLFLSSMKSPIIYSIEQGRNIYLQSFLLLIISVEESNPLW